jgi:hypothetical protein
LNEVVRKEAMIKEREAFSSLPFDLVVFAFRLSQCISRERRVSFLRCRGGRAFRCSNRARERTRGKTRSSAKSPDDAPPSLRSPRTASSSLSLELREEVGAGLPSMLSEREATT